MAFNLLTKIFGSRNDRLLKQYSRRVKEINALEPAIQALSDEQLAAKTQEFRARIASAVADVRIRRRFMSTSIETMETFWRADLSPV